MKCFDIHPKRTSFRSPWQNGIAERSLAAVVANCDHVIVLNEHHLKRLLNDYIRYYHEDRTHLGLGKETPANRRPERSPATTSSIVSLPRVGGLHHRYRLAA
jgi:transposase InsO family protein